MKAPRGLKLFGLSIAILCPAALSAQPLTITKFFGAGSIPLGGSTTLQFQINNVNEGGPTQTGVHFTDNLPAGLVVATPNGLTSPACGGGTITATAGSSSISLTGATLVDPATVGISGCQFSVNVRGTSPGVKYNTTTPISSDTVTNGSASANITVLANAPTLVKAFGAADVQTGNSTSLSFTVTNPNAGTTLTGVGFTDPLPAGLVVSTPNGLTVSSCSGATITASAGSGTITVAGLTLAANANCTFSVNVTATLAGAKTNTTAAVTSNESGPGGTATARINVVAVTPTLSAPVLAGLALLLGGLGTLFARRVQGRC